MFCTAGAASPAAASVKLRPSAETIGSRSPLWPMAIRGAPALAGRRPGHRSCTEVWYTLFEMIELWDKRDKEMVMLRSLNDLEHYSVSASDGDLGKVVDFLLDDERWVVRYLVVETGGFLDGRRVLISPISFRHAEWSTRRFHLALTVDKVKHSPSVDLDKPVSRQHELDYYRYYSYPYYWGYASPWGIGGYPGLLAAGNWSEVPDEQSAQASGDVHLRSAREVRGYRVQGSDQPVGEVADFVVDDESWEIRYLAVATGTWGFGKKVLVAPHWATRISWQEQEICLAMSRQAVRDSPAWDATAAVNREYEERLYDYYGRPVYWSGGDRPAAAHGALRAAQ